MEDVAEKIEIKQKFPGWREMLKPVKKFEEGRLSYLSLPKQVNSDFFKMPFGDVERDFENLKLPENWKEIFLEALKEHWKRTEHLSFSWTSVSDAVHVRINVITTSELAIRRTCRLEELSL